MSWLVGEIPLKILLFSENAITNQKKERKSLLVDPDGPPQPSLHQSRLKEALTW